MSEINMEQVIQALGNMPVMELIKLTKEMEEKWGVEAKPQVQQLTSLPAPETKVAEKTEFDVVIVSVAADKKIAAIKTARELLGIGLLESKALIESLPKTIKEGISKEEAEELKRKLAEAGATVEVK
jgi:large subunit ribosomal protein L7/L12